MRNIILKFWLPAFLLVFIYNCSSQNNSKQTGNKLQITADDRMPAVSGQFYPADSTELKSVLKSLFLSARPNASRDVIAIISPHAGYVFSGEVAASSFNQIDKNRQYDNVFVIATSHRMQLNGASVYTKGNYVTPLGVIEVNKELGNNLKKNNRVFDFDEMAHLNEHSLEVQLPFLQYSLKKPFKLVPIIIGTYDPALIKQIAAALRPWFNSNNLFVISTDFSHYPDYNDAKISDKMIADAILSNKPDELIRCVKLPANNVSNLETRICSWPSVLTLLYLTAENPDASFKLIQYKNSGDVVNGDKKRVVGYNAIAVELNSGFKLNDNEKKQLLGIARETIKQYLINKTEPVFSEKDFSPKLLTSCGAFVTLKKNGILRGCIGTFFPTEPLYRVVENMAVSAAVNDSRFPAVTLDELNQLEIEISVLTPLKQIKSIDEFELGRHGIYIRKGYASGTFLPQVAIETKWTKEQFLGYCSSEKAGLGWDGWKTADLYTYEAIVFSEDHFTEKNGK
jgi:AmmeMemoRadiSam system protein B/AmmeMemoRadiSam system protein A